MTHNPDKLRERVAKEIAHADFNAQDNVDFEDSGLFIAQNWDEYLPHADAAIAATKAVELREALTELLHQSGSIFDEQAKFAAECKARALLAQIDGEDL